jgi:glycosyltransferase involved in cell wall biosynthesis
MNVLGLALYGSLAASTRVRLQQYVPALRQAGIHLDIQPLLGDDYLHSRFGGGKLPVAGMLGSALRRLANLLGARRYDLAVVYCEVLPLAPAWLEKALLRIPFIYDLDDAFYLKYVRGPFLPLQAMLGGKMDALMSAARAVTAGSGVLASHARRFNRNTVLLPTVVDTARYRVAEVAAHRPFTVGWIGSPSTAPYLADMVAPLSRLGRGGDVRFVVIGGKAPAVPHVEVVEQPWSEATEVELIRQFDVGVMPLPDTEWARGKCAFKLIQYMACGVPVIGARVGANIDVVTPDCGFLAASEDDWVQALESLRADAGLARRLGVAGRLRVEKNYSLGSASPVLVNLMKSVARI